MDKQVVKIFQNITGFEIETINDYIRKGMPTETIYDSFAWYFKDKKREDMNPLAKVRLDTAKLTYNKAVGKLVNKDLMMKRVNEALAYIKTEILGSAGSLSMEVQNKDVQKAKLIIDKFLVDRLNEVADKVALILDKKETSTEYRKKYQ